jgi:hypothetical protein
VELVLVLNGSRTEIDDAVVEEKFKIPGVFKPKDGEFQLACKCLRLLIQLFELLVPSMAIC